MPGLDQMLWRIVAWSSDEPLCTWVHIIYTHEYVYVYIYMCIYIYVCICIEYFLGHIYICMYMDLYVCREISKSACYKLVVPSKVEF
jgi:hypothetical protein